METECEQTDHLEIRIQRRVGVRVRELRLAAYLKVSFDPWQEAVAQARCDLLAEGTGFRNGRGS